MSAYNSIVSGYEVKVALILKRFFSLLSTFIANGYISS